MVTSDFTLEAQTLGLQRRLDERVAILLEAVPRRL
jgi:hypothetical protein